MLFVSGTLAIPMFAQGLSALPAPGYVVRVHGWQGMVGVTVLPPPRSRSGVQQSSLRILHDVEPTLGVSSSGSYADVCVVLRDRDVQAGTAG